MAVQSIFSGRRRTHPNRFSVHLTHKQDQPAREPELTYTDNVSVMAPACFQRPGNWRSGTGDFLER